MNPPPTPACRRALSARSVRHQARDACSFFFRLFFFNQRRPRYFDVTELLFKNHFSVEVTVCVVGGAVQAKPTPRGHSNARRAILASRLPRDIGIAIRASSRLLGLFMVIKLLTPDSDGVI